MRAARAHSAFVASICRFTDTMASLVRNTSYSDVIDKIKADIEKD